MILYAFKAWMFLHKYDDKCFTHRVSPQLHGPRNAVYVRMNVLALLSELVRDGNRWDLVRAGHPVAGEPWTDVGDHRRLVVAGAAASLVALRWSEADVLVMDSEFRPAAGWVCHACKAMRVRAARTRACPYCAEHALHILNVRQALLDLATENGVAVEIADQSGVLKQLGGVGCLLRSGARPATAVHRMRLPCR